MDKLADPSGAELRTAVEGILTDWRATFPGIAARGQTLGFFARCLRLLDAGMSDEALRLLSPGRWKQGVDFVGVPPEILDRTDALCARAEAIVRAGHVSKTGEVLESIVDSWL